VTLAPVSWSQEVTADFFFCDSLWSETCPSIKKREGYPCNTRPQKGRQISAEEIGIVEEFYVSDEYSRLMPDMNDYISVRLQDGEKKTKIQKRLLLLNIDELIFTFLKSIAWINFVWSAAANPNSTS
jgi:hypothetical protein